MSRWTKDNTIELSAIIVGALVGGYLIEQLVRAIL